MLFLGPSPPAPAPKDSQSSHPHAPPSSLFFFFLSARGKKRSKWVNKTKKKRKVKYANDSSIPPALSPSSHSPSPALPPSRCLPNPNLLFANPLGFATRKSSQSACLGREQLGKRAASLPCGLKASNGDTPQLYLARQNIGLCCAVEVSRHTNPLQENHKEWIPV